MDGIQVLTLIGSVILALVALAALFLLPRISRPAGKGLLLLGVLVALGTAWTTGTQAFAPAAQTGWALSTPSGTPRPANFVDARSLDQTIQVELRYATTNNFTGEKVDGYESSDVVILQEDAAAALAAVQEELAASNLGLLVYDAYRPTTAVEFFQAWSQNPDDSTKAEYYPTFEKPQLFELGYIADHSKHSLGGTVDLTIIDLTTGSPLDMGGPFDFFGERSHYDAEGLSAEQTENRALLREVMTAHGFEPYEMEWWHFTYPLRDAVAQSFPVR